MNINVEKYCDATRGMDAAAMQCFTGCLLSVVSQTLMIMVISEEKGRIEGTMAEGDMLQARSKRPRGKGDAKRDYSDSESSSESDNEPDPLARYRQQGPAYGGRNYKTAGYH